MALYHADIADIDLDTGTVHRTFAQKTISEGDADANRYGIRLWRSGEPVTIDGGVCMGYFIRHGSGDTVTINGGEFSGQEAWVDLPQSCYAQDGGFSLVIKLVNSTITGTMRIVDGTVVDSMIGAPIDPGSVVPDLSSLLTVIDRAEDAVEAIENFSVYAELVKDDNYRIVVNTTGS